MNLKKPRLQDEAFLAEVAAARASRGASPERAPLHLWWLGQSGYLLHWNGRSILLDPYLSDSLTRKYSATDKPHVRMTERVVAPERLEGIDLISSSHSHTDHLDPETLKPLFRVNPGAWMIGPAANRPMLRERTGLPDDRILGLDPSLPTPSFPFEGVRFHPVPAAHETLERTPEGLLACLGYVIEAGPYRIYHSGDTVRFDGMIEWLTPYSVDLALLPINGRAPERRVAGNLRGREAAQLAREIGAGWVIPCHYDLFEFNTATPDEFVEACRGLGQPHRVLEQGECFTLPAVP